MKEFIKRYLKSHVWVQQVIRTQKSRKFSGSASFWDERYAAGGNSGAGSYNELAEFKAAILNQFVKQHNIKSVIELGCGDGNQLKLATYPQYLGIDVSPVAIQTCQTLFQNDFTKQFKLMSAYKQEKAELSLSLDVVYHLIEDTVFDSYMNKLFDAASRFVIVYASNTEAQISSWAPHVRHRKFTTWIETWRNDWLLQQHIPNVYPFKKNRQGSDEPSSFADFYIFGKRGY